MSVHALVPQAGRYHCSIERGCFALERVPRSEKGRVRSAMRRSEIAGERKKSWVVGSSIDSMRILRGPMMGLLACIVGSKVARKRNGIYGRRWLH